MLRRRWRGEPRFPMTVVGHGRIRHADLAERSRQRLSELAGTAPAGWGLLFVVDERDHRWTLYLPDPEFTVLFASAAQTLDLATDLFRTKFPCWNDGWSIS
ncbi:hypothetical protein ACGFH8_17175 [Micromonospora sp. NPDC049175]|uniref:hypothetical protein n=1 Tax=Micromonospora sp. NPDC049175 TaxID=3364266 RepID=UPI003717D71D